MNLAPQITFRNLPPSEAVESSIRDHITKLNRYYDHITSCRVVVEGSTRHHQGNLYHIAIDLRVPGKELVVKRDPGHNQAHEDIYVAIRDAFDTAERELKEFVERQRS